MNRRSTDDPVPLSNLIVAWISLAAVFNLPASWVVRSDTPDLELPAFFFVGVLLGQLSIGGYWAVFGPQRLAVRWPLAFAVGLALWTEVDIGRSMGLLGYGEEINEVLPNMAILPMVLLLAQVPLWICRGVGGHATAHIGENAQRSCRGGRQCGTLHWTVAAAATAAALGLARVGAERLWPERPVSVSLLHEVFPAALFAMGTCLLCVPPVMFAALGARSVKNALLALAAYALLLAGAVSQVRYMLDNKGWAACMASGLALIAGTMFVLYGSLLLLRHFGYRLVRPDRPLPGPGDAKKRVARAATKPLRVRAAKDDSDAATPTPDGDGSDDEAQNAQSAS